MQQIEIGKRKRHASMHQCPTPSSKPGPSAKSSSHRHANCQLSRFQKNVYNRSTSSSSPLPAPPSINTSYSTPMYSHHSPSSPHQPSIDKNTSYSSPPPAPAAHKPEVPLSCSPYLQSDCRSYHLSKSCNWSHTSHLHHNQRCQRSYT